MSKEAAAAGPTPTGDHAALAEEFPDDVVAYAVTEDGHGITQVNPESLFVVARRVKQMGYPILSCLSAYDTGSDVGVFYAFVKLANKPEDWGELRLRVLMPRKDADGKPAETATQSLCDLYPAAGWHEREMWDLFGVQFVGNPDLRRMFLPEGWTGHPGLKDYSEPEQFVAMKDGEDIVLKTNEEGSW